jgi:acyl-CoA thioesterase FadM
MGFVLPLIGELAYTANLNIDYVGPAPLHRELRFTARLRDRAGRKLWIEAHGESDEGVFVRAEALFLAVELTHFANHDNTAN